jgi:hypothetical protein
VHGGKITKLQFTQIMFWWMIITPAIGEIILGRAPDFEDLFEDDNHEWLKFFGWNTVGNAASMIPLGSQIQRAALDKRQGVSIGTGSRVLEEFAYGLGGIGQAIGGEPIEGTAAAIEHIGKAAWMYYGLPGLVQSQRLVKTAVMLSGGHEVSVRQPLFGRNK